MIQIRVTKRQINSCDFVIYLLDKEAQSTGYIKSIFQERKKKRRRKIVSIFDDYKSGKNEKDIDKSLDDSSRSLSLLPRMENTMRNQNSI